MIWVVVGGQYGSEGKGALCAHLARRYGFKAAVRGGGPQAGHTFWSDGRKRVVRQVPVACVVDPACWGYIGPGAVIDVEVVEREVEENGLLGNFWVHPAAVCVHPSYRRIEEEMSGEGMLPGTTKEGVGVARARRAFRTAQPVSGFEFPWVDRDLSRYKQVLDWARGYNMVMAEGAQGFGLSVWHGEYPYVTSADTTPAAVLSECGLPARHITRTIVVLRTFPIRVGGASGPLASETSWEELGRPPEVTTVTKRQRRIGRFDWRQFDLMEKIVQPTHAALMFADYLDERIRTSRIEDCPEVKRLWWMLNNRVVTPWIGVGGERYEVREVADEAGFLRVPGSPSADAPRA